MSEQTQEPGQGEPTEPPEPAEPDAEPVEPIEPDEPQEPAGEPGEPAAPAPDALTEKDYEAIGKKLDAETKRHVERVAAICGPNFAYLTPCELCEPNMPGFRLPKVLDEETKAAVRYAIGDRQPENWQADQYSRECEACAGLGEVLTGSKVTGQSTLVCLICGGKGWTPIGPERQGGVFPKPALVAPSNGEGSPAALPAVDPPEVADLKARGYVVISPVGSSG